MFETLKESIIEAWQWNKSGFVGLCVMATLIAGVVIYADVTGIHSVAACKTRC